jgi:uncharacterized protein (TIGR03067 family)
VSRFDRRSLLATFAGLALAGFAHAEPWQPDIERLIQQLGSKRFREREAATKALDKVGEPALEPLRKAAKDDADAEVRRRAQEAVKRLDARRRLGTWHIVRAEFRGQVLKKLPLDNYELTFTPDGVEGALLMFGSGTCVVDALPRPQHIDMRFYGEADSGRRWLRWTYLGIYRFEKDELVVCFSTGQKPHRPTAFKTDKDAPVMLYRMRRQKPRP